MFFVLVVMPIGAALIKAASKAKTVSRQRRALKEDLEEMKERFGDLKNRRLQTINVMLTKKEAEFFENTSPGRFLEARAVSQDAANAIEGKV